MSPDGDQAHPIALAKLIGDIAIGNWRTRWGSVSVRAKAEFCAILLRHT
jgi:hypothetical protein